MLTIEKSKAETKKTIVEAKKSIAEANVIEVQKAQVSDDRIFNLLMKRKQLLFLLIEPMSALCHLHQNSYLFFSSSSYFFFVA